MEKDKLKSIVNNMCKELLNIIDEEKALYKAKNNGKDQMQMEEI